MNDNISKKTWMEFKQSEISRWVNRSLHLFGWAICIDINEDENIIDIYPARVKYCGFNEISVENGSKGLTEYLSKEIKILEKEVWNE